MLRFPKTALELIIKMMGIGTSPSANSAWKVETATPDTSSSRTGRLQHPTSKSAQIHEPNRTVKKIGERPRVDALSSMTKTIGSPALAGSCDDWGGPGHAASS
jgi:hypothetical protein